MSVVVIERNAGRTCGTDLSSTLSRVLHELPYDRLFVLTDEVTGRVCMPLLEGCDALKHAVHLEVGATDLHKNLASLEQVWLSLGRYGASRRSLLVNLGGGMVTDLGGFAAGTFKRGIRYLNIPTTLLAMVDAAVGGKTGINLNGLKNEVGLFHAPERIIIDTTFLCTLDHANLLSGYAEMLKHGLLSDAGTLDRLLAVNLDNPDVGQLAALVSDSAEVKLRIVARDPLEQGIRKALNLGHTAGHAYESWAFSHVPCLHGHAVAWGLLTALRLSCLKCGFPVEAARRTEAFVRRHYAPHPAAAAPFDALFDLMLHDKKNEAGTLRFALLADIGTPRIDQTVSREELRAVMCMLSRPEHDMLSS